MTEHLIIRGTRDAGKTTTCGVLYEELVKKASFSKLYNMGWDEIEGLQYDEEGALYDFIAVIIIGDCVIIIISQGDIAGDLEAILDKLTDKDFVKKITNGKADIGFIICCARSVNKKNSTFRMLEDRIPKQQRKEFWVADKTDQKEQIKENKKKLVKEIISYLGKD
jgi:hypothetical protein